MSKPLSYPMPAPVQGPARSPKPMPDCIHEIFEQQAKRAPNRIALTFNGESITYGRLNALANRLAHSLRTAGVHTETPVAIYLDRSPDLVIAILATLKAGGCYVPIDLTYPRDRIGFILQDTAAPVLLTESRLLGALPETAAEVICLEAFHLGMDTGSFSNLAGGATRESAAYIIYTSGSTGKPKGVIVTHRNVVRLLQSTEPWFGFSMEDVWALFHSCSFDMSVWELWGALFFGGRLVIVPHLTTRSPVDFYELLAREKVTFLNQTPSAFRQLIWAEGTAPRQLPLSLRFVTCGGEALVLDSLKPWFDRHGDTQPVIVNMYGITETTVHTTYRPICRADLSSGAGSVIGVPIPDLQVYLLDEQLQPVKPGEPGEIFVGGAGVARGYLRRAELTSQRFLPDPFRNESGARLYRSGDLARINDQGEMEYLGRMDHQV
ncbi:MAG TPA: amino acid adenylation domain-containing protein, partial [Clostridia bacterium]|nr:amino acid adenylation domain-containing protein [Clostridia bacterium]